MGSATEDSGTDIEGIMNTLNAVQRDAMESKREKDTFASIWFPPSSSPLGFGKSSFISKLWVYIGVLADETARVTGPVCRKPCRHHKYRRPLLTLPSKLRLQIWLSQAEHTSTSYVVDRGTCRFRRHDRQGQFAQEGRELCRPRGFFFLASPDAGLFASNASRNATRPESVPTAPCVGRCNVPDLQRSGTYRVVVP